MSKEFRGNTLIVNQGIYFRLVVDSVYALWAPFGVDDDLVDPEMLAVYGREYLTL